MFGENIMCRHVPKVPYGSYAPGIESVGCATWIEGSLYISSNLNDGICI